jgi:hypothetical protein
MSKPVVLITGALTGIGRATPVAFAIREFPSTGNATNPRFSIGPCGRTFGQYAFKLALESKGEERPAP